MSEQDWTPVTIGNRINNRSGNTIHRPQPNYSADFHIIKKVENATGPVKLKALSVESRQAMTSARTALKLTQIEVNQRAAFAPNSIRDFESGRTTPSQSQLSILNRILKTNLKLT